MISLLNYLTLFGVLFSFQVSACDFIKNDCATGFRCVFSFQDQPAECVADYKGKYLELAGAFSYRRDLTCDQGTYTESRASHSYLNALYAIDIHTPHENSKGAKVYAGVAGKVAIYNGCETENDYCGAGFGNQVKIFHQDGFIVLYAHLEKVKVKNGQLVKAGDLIGIEGNSGATGEKNRHLHQSVHFDWRPMGIEYWSQLGYLPFSVPFTFKICDPEVVHACVPKLVNVKDLKCVRDNFEAAHFIFSKVSNN